MIFSYFIPYKYTPNISSMVRIVRPEKNSLVTFDLPVRLFKKCKQKQSLYHFIYGLHLCFNSKTDKANDLIELCRPTY